MKRINDEGFTFVETIVVIAVILILSAAVSFTAFRYIDQAKTASCRNQIATFKLALQSYYLDCGSYPTESQSLTALWEKPIFAPIPFSWNGPYIDMEIPKDPWGFDYIYKSPGQNGLAFTIMSYGADGKEGGEGNNEDIVSWK